MNTEIQPKKINVNLTIDEDLLKLCDDRAHNKSALVSKLLRQYFFPSPTILEIRSLLEKPAPLLKKDIIDIMHHIEKRLGRLELESEIQDEMDKEGKSNANQNN
jgi:hypothetical protein